MASAPDPLFIEFAGWFGVSENPGNRLFSFKRQFLASVRAAVGFIEIKSKTKSSEVVRLSTARLAGKPFIRCGVQSVVVWLRNRPRGKGDWLEMGLRADSHQKAQELREFLVKTAWLPRAAAPPASPAPAPAAAADVAAAAPTAAAVVVRAADSPSDQSSPATPTPAPVVSTSGGHGGQAGPTGHAGPSAGHGSDSDDEVQWLDDVNGGLKMRLRVCKDRPSCTEVIAPPSPSATIVNHRPMIVKREERETAPPPVALPRLQIHRERSASRDAARVLQFAAASPRMQQQPPTAFPFPAVSQSQSMLQQQQQQRSASPFQMQQLLGQSLQQQPPSPLVQQWGAVPSAMDSSSFLQTPAPSPLLQPLDMLQQLRQAFLPVQEQQPLQQPQSQFQALLQQLQQSQQQQQPAFCTGSMGALGNAPMGNYGGANFDNYCVGGVFGAQPQQQQQQPQQLALGTGDDPEYAKFAAEFRILAQRVDLLPPEKRRMAIAVAESITNMMCGM